MIVYGPVSIPLTGFDVSDWAYFHQSTVMGPGHFTSLVTIGLW